MGGNVEIFGQRPTPIGFDKLDRQCVADAIYQVLEKINNNFEEYTGEKLWSSELFNKKTFISGSSYYLFCEDISYTDLIEVKKTFGDIDLMVDSAHCTSLSKWFDHIFEDQPFSGVKFLGCRPSGNQYITLWHIQALDSTVQIDFEAVDFINGQPSEWARFSHSSAWSDMQHGIKGVAHKYIFRAMQATNLFTFILQPKTSRGKEKVITASRRAFSLKGIRTKYVNVMDNTNPLKPTPVRKDGLQVLKEISVEECPYDTNIASICRHYFPRFQAHKDLEKMWSFVGVVDLINQHRSIDDRALIFNGFIRILWGPGAQQMYRCKNQDRVEKMKMIDYLEKNLDVNKSMVDNWRKIACTYYTKD